jgi:hypothetical protein
MWSVWVLPFAVLMVASDALTPAQIATCEDVWWNSEDAWADARQHWELETAFPLRFVPTDDDVDAFSLELGDKGAKDKVKQIFEAWKEANKIIVAAAPAPAATALEPCMQPKRSDLTSAGCSGRGCVSPLCLRGTFANHELEHIVGKASGEMLGMNKDILGNTVMADRAWNEAVALPTAENRGTKIRVYGLVLSFAARFWIHHCHRKATTLVESEARASEESAREATRAAAAAALTPTEAAETAAEGVRAADDAVKAASDACTTETREDADRELYIETACKAATTAVRHARATAAHASDATRDVVAERNQRRDRQKEPDTDVLSKLFDAVTEAKRSSDECTSALNALSASNRNPRTTRSKSSAWPRAISAAQAAAEDATFVAKKAFEVLQAAHAVARVSADSLSAVTFVSADGSPGGDHGATSSPLSLAPPATAILTPMPYPRPHGTTPTSSSSTAARRTLDAFCEEE